MLNPLSRAGRRREAFSGLVRAHGPGLVVLARRLVGSGDAEDVVQSALASAWRHFASMEALRDPRAWLRRFVLHEAANVQGRRKRRPAAIPFEDSDPVGSGEDVLAILEREITHSSRRDSRALLEVLDHGLAAAMQALNADERTTLTLRAVAGLSYKEIAEAMGVPIGTVMSRLCRAREKVRAELERRQPAARPEDLPGGGSNIAQGGRQLDGAAP